MTQKNNRNNLSKDSVFTELNLTVVEATPAKGFDNDIGVLLLNVGDDKEYSVFGWLSTAGIFYFHCFSDSSTIARIEKGLMDLGFFVKPRVYNPNKK